MTFPCISLDEFQMYIDYFTKLSIDLLRLDGAHGTATDEIWIRKYFEGSGRGLIVAPRHYMRSGTAGTHEKGQLEER